MAPQQYRLRLLASASANPFREISHRAANESGPALVRPFLAELLEHSKRRGIERHRYCFHIVKLMLSPSPCKFPTGCGIPNRADSTTSAIEVHKPVPLGRLDG